MARNRNIDLVQSGLLPILGLNFVITLLFGFSLAAHVGGLLGGLLVTFVIEELGRRRGNTTVARGRVLRARQRRGDRRLDLRRLRLEADHAARRLGHEPRVQRVGQPLEALDEARAGA